MNVAAQLSQKLLSVLPGLPPAVAFLVATAAILLGAAAAIGGGLDRVAISTGWARIRAWFDLQDELRALLASDLVQELLARQGAEATLVRQQVEASISTSISTSVPPVTFPTFTTPQEVDQYLMAWSQLLLAGLITNLTFNQVGAHAAREYDRLSAPPALAPSLPLTQVEVPGFGAVGVRVSVRAGAAAPQVLAPTAPLQPIILTGPTPQVSVTNQVDTSAIARALQDAIAAQTKALQGSITALEGALTKALPGVGTGLGVGVLPGLATLSSAIAGVGAGVATGVVGQAQNLGHLFQLGRNQCFGGTAGALLGLTLPIAIGAFSLKALNSQEGIGGFIRDKIGDWIEGAMEQAPYPTPATPENVSQAATDRLRQALSFGLQAHMWAIMAESSFVLKQLGLPQVAGFLAEMAGFKRVAEATIGEVEKAALSIPARFFALRKYRPNIPGLGDLEEMYAKKEIPFEAREGVLGLRQALALWGYSDAWAGVYKEHLWKDPRLGEIIRIGQFFNPALSPETRLPSASTAAWMERAGIGAYAERPGDWYYAWRAAKGGYDPNDIPILVETARRAVTRREQTLFLDAITRLARDGFIPLERARELTREGWGVTAGPFASGDPIEARSRAIELQQDYKLLSDTRSVIVMSMSRGLITRAEARERLGALGLDGQRVELEVLKATLGMLPGMRVALERPEAVLEEAGMEVE